MTCGLSIAGALLLVFMPYAVSFATDYTVKAGGGGTYTTISACAAAMGNGDTCTVFAGTYNEHVTITAGGVGSYKILQVNGSDLVYVYDFTLNSHTKISGFHIQNPSSPASANCVTIVDTATDIFITNNTLYACGSLAMIAGSSSGATNSYVYIQNNTLSYSCSTSGSPNTCTGMAIHGDHHLVEGNDLSHVSDGASWSGSYNIFRSNKMHSTTNTECGSNSNNCHTDFLETEPSRATQYNIIEGNILLNNVGPDGHAYLMQADACSGNCYNLIVRYNVGAHVGSGGIIDDNAGSTAVAGFSSVKAYNNTWVDFSNYGTVASYGTNNAFTNRSTNGASINDLFYYPASMIDYNPYQFAVSSSDHSSEPYTVRNNLAWCTGATCNLRGVVYGTGAFLDVTSNIKSDPLFVNYASNDFSLSTGSPAIAAGSYLTTVAVADTSSGTSLILTDAAYFQDGSGLSGAYGDCIAVGTVSNTACISAVNYSTNTVTLSSALSRSDGDNVWLYSDSRQRRVLYGAAPNIGAFVPSLISAQLGPGARLGPGAYAGSVAAGGAPVAFSSGFTNGFR